MNDVLWILAGAFAAWQFIIAALGVAYASQGRSVNIGVIPGILAVAFAIAAVLV